jgi:hypothetical protein
MCVMRGTTILAPFYGKERYMPTNDQQSCYLSCRISRRLSAKLNTLTDATGRSRSDVLRWLILQARLQDFPQGWVETATVERRLQTER